MLTLLLAFYKGTATYYAERGVTIEAVDLTACGNVSDALSAHQFDAIINLPPVSKSGRELHAGVGPLIRQHAVEHKVALVTNIKCARLLVQALHLCPQRAAVTVVDCQSAAPLSVRKTSPGLDVQSDFTNERPGA